MAKNYQDIYNSVYVTGNKMDWTNAMIRGNGIPLDIYSVFDEYNKAVKFAATNAVAYEGQVLAVTENGDTTVYVITPAKQGTIIIDETSVDVYLKEVGSATSGDNRTIVLNNGVLSLKNFGIEYYKYYPAVEADEELGIEAKDSYYELTKGWTDGLQPKVINSGTLDDPIYEIAWFEPSTTTVEGLSEKIITIEDVIKEQSKSILKNSTDITNEITTRENADKANSDAINAIVLDYLKNEDKTELQNQITANKNNIDKLNGDSTIDGSVDKKINDAINAFATEITDNGAIDKFAELVEYVNKHGGEAAEMATAIETLETKVGEKSVAVQISEAIIAENLDQYATDADLTSISNRVDILENKSHHEHANKSLLDTYTQTEEDIADAVIKKHKHENATLLDDITEDNIVAWNNSERNIIASIDDTQFNIDDSRNLTLLDISISKVTGLQDILDAKANKGTTLAEYGITDAYTKTETLDKIAEKITEINGGESAGEVLSQLNSYKEINDNRVETIENKLINIDDNAQVNVLESIKINGIAQNIVDKSIDISIATDSLLGVVMSSVAENKISVSEDGTMEVNSLNVNKLVQNEGAILILNGGTSTV